MPRLTIRRLMLVVGVVAGILGLYRSLGSAYLVLLALSAIMAVLVWQVVRRLPRLAAWTFGVSAFLVNASVAPVCAYLCSIGGFALMVLASISMFPLVLGCGSAWAMAGPDPRRFPRAAAWSIVIVLGFLPISMMSTLWPLRFAFTLSRPSMDRLADRVAAGETLAFPEWAGLYRIVDAKREPRNGNVALIIDADPSGRSAFVRVVARSESYGPMVNLNFNVPVGGPWRYQNED
jgi:hypothetical protein